MGSVGPVNDLWWYIGEPPAPPTSESFNMGAALRTAMAYGPVPDPLGAPTSPCQSPTSSGLGTADGRSS
jgi:hypothetical protein